MKHNHVSDVMTSKVVTAHVDTPFKNIVTTLARHNISGMPVVDDDGHVLGIVSEADLLPKKVCKDLYYDDRARAAIHGRRHRAERHKAGGDTAGEVMNTPALTIAPDRNIAEAARMLARHTIKRLPVVDEENRLVGIVSRFDLLIPYLRPDDDIRDEVIREVVVRSLWKRPHAVRVDVDDGVVTLTGQVELDIVIPIAVSLAMAVDGVVDVVNQLTYAHKSRQVPHLVVDPLVKADLRWPTHTTNDEALMPWHVGLAVLPSHRDVPAPGPIGDNPTRRANLRPRRRQGGAGPSARRALRPARCPHHSFRRRAELARYRTCATDRAAPRSGARRLGVIPQSTDRTDELRPRLVTLIGSDAPQLLLRPGYGPEPAPSHRRDPDDVFVE